MALNQFASIDLGQAEEQVAFSATTTTTKSVEIAFDSAEITSRADLEVCIEKIRCAIEKRSTFPDLIP